MSGVADPTPGQTFTGGRGSRLFGRRERGGVLLASASTVVVFGAIGYLVVTAPGWARVQQAFFNGDVFAASFPDIARALLPDRAYDGIVRRLMGTRA